VNEQVNEWIFNSVGKEKKGGGNERKDRKRMKPAGPHELR
jgi:hypothetical protein